MEQSTIKPSKLKKGDVIVTQFAGKHRPCVIISVGKERVAYIPLTSNEGVMVTIPCEGRFYEGSFFSMGVGFATIDNAMKHFRGIYEHNKSLKKAIEHLKLELLKL